MEALEVIFAITAVAGVGILIWLNTKSGKKWMANL